VAIHTRRIIYSPTELPRAEWSRDTRTVTSENASGCDIGQPEVPTRGGSHPEVGDQAKEFPSCLLVRDDRPCNHFALVYKLPVSPALLDLILFLFLSSTTSYLAHSRHYGHRAFV
jgi:hypothetical protein